MFKDYVFMEDRERRVFFVATKKRWRERHAMESVTLPIEVPEFSQVAESAFKYSGKGGMKGGREKLAALGMKEVHW